MSTREAIETMQRTFTTHGAFTLKPGESMHAAVARHNVPNACGVYVVTAPIPARPIVYIGKGGTMLKNGNWKRQKLRGRLTAVRAVLFPKYITDNNLDGLLFEWFVTFDDSVKVLPTLVELQLLQAFFTEHGCLPEINKCA